MRTNIYSLFIPIVLAAACGKGALEFSPTDSGSGEELLKDAGSALSSLNGVYRSMWTAGWSTTGNTHQCFGIAAYALAWDVMADDLIMQSQGNGWFWYDHIYNVKTMYTSSNWRSYDVWYAHYKWIADVNYIIDAAEAMAGKEADKAYVVGQAYAVRALCYLDLANWFARPVYNPLTGTWRGSEAGVPLYTTGTDIKTGGQPRASLEDVYGRIDTDLDSAVVLLTKGLSSTLDNGSKSHINLYTALGIKSRSALAQGKWEEAYKAAMQVIDSGVYAIGGENELMNGMNSLDAADVMWGAGIENAEQSGGYAGFFTHMDNLDGAYGKSAPKLISRALYNRISTSDIRARWWDPDNEESPFLSRKFAFSNVESWLGDYLYMRVEELYFSAAEAALRNGDEAEARRLMNLVMAPRNPAYDAGAYSGTFLGATTTTWTGSLLENILTQRRIELWGEYGRLFDVRRLGQGIDRKAEDGFSSECIATMTRNGVDITRPDTYDWVLTIPKDELDANPNINEEDQNP